MNNLLQKLLIASVCVYFSVGLYAQKQIAPFSTGHSGTGSNIDVKYHKCYWRVNPDSTIKAIGGYVQTNFVTINDSVNTITFDLINNLLVDSVLFHNAKLAATNIKHASNILTIGLGTYIRKNNLDSVTIYYHGTPPSPSGASAGYVKARDFVTGQNYICTLSESYEDKNWWPCKADMQDKIDSIDIIVNVPWSGADTFWVASNGRLLDSTISNKSRTFRFHSAYPMASYLVCISVARYNRYYSGTIRIGKAEVPVVYNLIRGKSPQQDSGIVAEMDKIKPVLTMFSSKWGDYPYMAEKYGFYEGLVNAGGMEHQTFSAIASGALTDLPTLVHELCHQWFGDKVTPATWNDLWLAEGFAHYSEALAAEFVPSLNQSAINDMANFKNAAISESMASTRIPDSSIGTSDLIWNTVYGSIVYDRGSMVASMLRCIAGDSLYFLALKNFLSSPGIAYKTATTDSLKYHFNKVLGRDISPFFTDYVWSYGNPTYDINSDNIGNNTLTVSVAAQTQSSGSNVPYFRSPVVLRVQGADVSEDTTITFFDWGNGNLSYAGNGLSAPISGNLLTYHFSFDPLYVTFDPNSVTLALGAIALDLQVLRFNVTTKGEENKAEILFDDNANNVAVMLERSSDGLHYTAIGKMELQPTAHNKQYTFSDSKPLKGNNFYRVFYTNAQGKKQYSKVIRLNNTNKSVAFSILDNPVKNTLHIQLATNAVGSASNNSFIITDMGGKKLIAKEFGASAGKDIHLDVATLPKGLYNISLVKDSAMIQTSQFSVY